MGLYLCIFAGDDGDEELDGMEVGGYDDFGEFRDLIARLLEDGTWKSVLGHIRGEAHPPLLVVTSRVADEHLWAEVLNLGGYDVLAKPFIAEEVRHVCTTASLWLMQLAAPRRTAAAG